MQYNEIQTARAENLARRLLGIRNGGIIPSLSPELGLSFDLPQHEDLEALAGYIRFGFAKQASAVAGEYSYAGINAYMLSQLVGVRLTVSSATAQGVWLVRFDQNIGFTSLIAPDQATWLDSRRQQSALSLSTSTVGMGSDSEAAVPPGLGLSGYGAHSVNIAANTPYTFPWVVLAPRTCLAVAAGTVNTTIIVTGECWMRDCLGDELTV